MKKVVGLDVGLIGCGCDDKLNANSSTQQQMAFFLTYLPEVLLKRSLSYVIFLFLLLISFFILTPTAQAVLLEDQKAWPDIFQTNQGFASPFISPNNDPKVNLLLLIGTQSSLDGLFKHTFTAPNNNQGDPLSDEDSQRLLESAFDIKKQQFPIEMIFDKAFAAQTYKDQKLNLTQRLKQFGVEYSPVVEKDYLSLNQFNQQVVGDHQLDNAQKQLLIGLRAAIFSYYHRSEIQQEKSSTSDEIIGGKIANLPDSDRIGEYKQYLIYLDAMMRKQYSDFAQMIGAEYVGVESMPEFPSAIIVPWLRESANAIYVNNLAAICIDKIRYLSTVDFTEEGAKIEYASLERMADGYHQSIVRFMNNYPENPYSLEIYQNGCNDFDTSVLKILFEPLISPHTFETQTEGLRTNTNLLTAYQIADAFVVASNLNNPTNLVDEVAPNYEFFSALKLIGDYQSAFENPKQMKKSEKAELLKNIANTRERLTQSNRNDLADFLLVNQTWYWDKNATKTIELIETMNLDIASAHRPDQFAYWMTLTEAYQSKKDVEQATSTLTALQAFADTAEGTDQALLPAQKAYISLRLNELNTPSQKPAKK